MILHLVDGESSLVSECRWTKVASEWLVRRILVRRLMFLSLVDGEIFLISERRRANFARKLLFFDGVSLAVKFQGDSI